MADITDVPELQHVDLGVLEKEYQTEAQINRFIESLDISAEVKLTISKIASISLSVGDKIIKIGKKIIEIIIMLSKKFPNTFIGIIIASLLVLLIAQIPLIGGLISYLLAPLLIGLSVTIGAIKDFKDTAFANKIAEAASVFDPLKQAGVRS